MATSSDENFLARWSRLKQRPEAAEDETQKGGEAPQPGDSGQTLAMRGPQGEDAGTIEGGGEQAGEGEADGLPQVRDFSDFDFDALDFNSDYTQFMKDDVPQDVRNTALRQLWVSNPVLANMDGLDDYCEDYTDAAMVPLGGLKTAYKIGRGFLSDAEVAEWESLGRPKVEDVADAASAETVADAGSAEDSGTAHGDDIVAAAPVDIADEQGSPGAACGAAVKQEEQEALASYEDERGEMRSEGSASKDPQSS